MFSLFCITFTPISFAPLEGGIAWSRAGPVATGTLITGLAAAMEPKSTDWLPYNQGGNQKVE